MPFIGSLASKCHTYIVAVILLLSEIMPIYSYCVEKKLVYITIAAPSSCQPFFCIECIKSNIRLSCNVKSVLDTKCL